MLAPPSPNLTVVVPVYNGCLFLADTIESLLQQTYDDYQSLRYGCIVHSTLCFQRDSLLRVGGYRAELYPVDDYDLLLRIEKQCRLAVINQPLIKYCVHSQAGTFKTFVSMDLKTRYAEVMAQRRRSGQIELSLPEFTEISHQGHSFKQLQMQLNRKGRLMFRNAGLLIGEGCLFQGLGQLCGSILLAPTHSLKRLMSLCLGKHREASII